MAIYEFRCDKCCRITVESHSITTDRKIIKCSFCGAVAEKIMSQTNFKLKGDKWGKDGYKGKR